MNFVAVAVGSALGGMLRYALAGWVMRLTMGAFPWGTLIVNIAGCALIGVLSTLFPSETRGFPWRLFLLPGLCGGFTTFSSFSLETHGLWRADAADKAFLYVAASVILCLLAVWAGIHLGSRITGNSSN